MAGLAGHTEKVTSWRIDRFVNEPAATNQKGLYRSSWLQKQEVSWGQTRSCSLSQSTIGYPMNSQQQPTKNDVNRQEARCLKIRTAKRQSSNGLGDFLQEAGTNKERIVRTKGSRLIQNGFPNNNPRKHVVAGLAGHTEKVTSWRIDRFVNEPAATNQKGLYRSSWLQKQEVSWGQTRSCSLSQSTIGYPMNSQQQQTKNDVNGQEVAWKF